MKRHLINRILKLLLLYIGIVLFFFYVFSLVSHIKSENPDLLAEADYKKKIQIIWDSQFHEVPPAEPEFELPLKDGVLPKGINSPYQWGKGDNRYVYVKSQKATTYASSTIYSEPVYDLPLSQRVRVVAIDPTLVTLNGKVTKWVFIVSPETSTPLGWITNDNLAYKNSFVPVNDWLVTDLSYCRDRSCATLYIRPNGIFTGEWTADDGGIFLGGKRKGQVYQCGPLLWLKTNDAYTNQTDDTVLIMYKSGDMHHEIKYKNSPLSTE